MWMKRHALQRLVGQSPFLRQLAIQALSALELLAMRGHKDAAALRLVAQRGRGGESLLTANEAFLLHSLAHAQAGLEGDLAEFGVYRGSSAEIIASAAGGRTLHLFDTFAGLPEPVAEERAVLKKGQFGASLGAVRERLRRFEQIRFHPGEFPASAAGCESLRFSFVHLDVDLFESTLAGLRFFYPRMVPGGIILSHDYSMLPGVERAFAEFLRGRPERTIELPSTQAMIVCLGGDGHSAAAPATLSLVQGAA